jgi:hypothetical protein
VYRAFHKVQGWAANFCQRRLMLDLENKSEPGALTEAPPRARSETRAATPAALSVFLLSAYSPPFSGGPAWLVENHRSKSVRIADSPETADVIIFVENHPPGDPYFFKVLNHPVRRAFPSRSVLYHDADRSVALMPTLSPSIERWQAGCGFLRPCHYFARLCENSGVNECTEGRRRNTPFQYAASFIGTSRTHPLRKRLLEHPARDVYYRDSNQARGWMMAGNDKQQYEQDYVDVILKSRFVLCPRGKGPSTYRLYEALQLGRAPIIISDQWMPPDGPDWSSFSIRVSEGEIDKLDHILRTYAEQAAVMGENARTAWENFFSPPATLDQLVTAAMDLIKIPPRATARIAACSQFLRHGHLRRLARWTLRRAGLMSTPDGGR